MKINNFLLALSAVHADIYEQEHLLDFDKEAKNREDIQYFLNDHLKANTKEGLDEFLISFNEKIVKNEAAQEYDPYLWDTALHEQFSSSLIDKNKNMLAYKYFEDVKCNLAMDISSFSWILRQLNNFSYIDERQYTQSMSDCGRLAKKHFSSWDEYAMSFYYENYTSAATTKDYFNEELLMKLLFNEDSPWNKVRWSNG